jgi:hypothetical protein
MIGPATQFAISEVEGLPPEDEDALFPVPFFPPVGQVATSTPTSAASIDADEFNTAIADVEAMN